MRSAMTRLQANPSRINPLVPVDLVIDHSVQVDVFGSADALYVGTFATTLSVGMLDTLTEFGS